MNKIASRAASIGKLAHRAAFSVRHALVLALLAIVTLPLLYAGQPVPGPEDVLPASTIAALIIPDPAAARAAAAKTRLGAMFSQPEMQEFLRPPLDQIKKSYRELQAANPFLPKPDDLEAVLPNFGLSIAAYERPDDPKQPFGVLVTLVSKDMEALKRSVPEQQRGILAEGNMMPMGPDVGAPMLAVANGHILLCHPGGDMPGFVESAMKPGANPNQKRLADIPEFKTIFDRSTNPAGSFCLAPVKLLGVLGKMHNQDMLKVLPVLNALKLQDCTALCITLGFSESSPVMDSSVSFAAKPQSGLFNLFMPPSATVNPANLKIAEVDAPFAAAGWFNFKGVVPLLEQAARAFSPEAGMGIAMGRQVAVQQLKIDPQAILENLTGDVVLAQTALDTGAPLSFSPGMVYSLGIQNPVQVEEGLTKLLAAIEGLAAQGGAKTLGIRSFHVKKMQYKAKNIYYVAGFVLPGMGAFCVNGDRLLCGTTVNALRRGIDQLEKSDNILSNKEFQASIARVSGKPFDPAALPPFSYALDNGTGTGSLILSMLTFAVETAPIAALAQLSSPQGPGGKAPPAPGEEAGEEPEAPPTMPRDPFQAYVTGPAGKVVIDVANAIDLGMWPDEGFFSHHRFPTAAVSIVSPNRVVSRFELPMPGPRSVISNNLPVMVACVAVIAAIAIPNLLRSRMAANEVAAIAACKAFAEAQDIYRRVDYNKDGVLEYAQSLHGENSLYETKAGAGDIALIDRSFARAEAGPGAAPKAGYYFKVLKGQGEGASGGKRSYIKDGRMTLGYALVAYPAQYDSTGRNTFIINNAGTIFMRDWGAETEKIVDEMTEFNPDETWAIAE